MGCRHNRMEEPEIAVGSPSKSAGEGKTDDSGDAKDDLEKAFETLIAQVVVPNEAVKVLSSIRPRP